MFRKIYFHDVEGDYANAIRVLLGNSASIVFHGVGIDVNGEYFSYEVLDENTDKALKTLSNYNIFFMRMEQ